MNTEIELYYKPGENGDLSGLDQRILDIYARNPRISPEEASKQLGVQTMTPARVLQRIREILNAQNTLGITHQKALVLQDLIKLRDAFWERIENGVDVITKDGDLVTVEVGANTLSGMTRLLKEWRSLIDSMAQDVGTEETRIRGANARAVNDMVTDAFQAFLRLMKERGHPLDLNVAYPIMEDALAAAFHRFEQKNADPTVEEIVDAEVVA